MIPTGLHTLDRHLLGGVRPGTILDIFGASGSGKTQFLFQLAANAVRSGGTVLYVDTTGGFRPERILEILEQSGHNQNLLQDILVYRVRSASEQMDVLHTIRRPVSLLAIDNVTDLFSFEYRGDGSALERNRLFMRYMRGLSGLAITRMIPVVLTNMVRFAGDREVENMRGAIGMFTHVGLHLSKKEGKRHGRVSWAGRGGTFQYRIISSGLTIPAEDI